MGAFDIPPDPTSGGKFKIYLELDIHQLKQTVDFFRRATVELRCRDSPTAEPSNPPPPTGVLSTSYAAPGAALPANPVLNQSWSSPSAGPGVDAVNPDGRPQRPTPYPFDQQAEVRKDLGNLGVSDARSPLTQPPQMSPNLMATSPPMPSAFVQPPPPPAPISKPHPGASGSGSAVAYSQPTQPPRGPPQRPPVAGVPKARPRIDDTHFAKWELSWRTDPLDHNNSAVTAMVYCPDLPGLPAMDGSTGWLVSASPKLLNLWGCNPHGGVGGEPSLQLLHSQEVVFESLDLAAEPNMSTMLIASMDRSEKRSCVSLHSLSGEDMLAPKGQFVIPPPTSRTPPTGSSYAQRVVSLYNLGEPLRKGFAVAYGDRIAIWGCGKSKDLQDTPLVDFKAHSQSVTVLSLSSSKPVLFSGSASGEVALWSLQGPPSKPLQTLNQHQKKVTGIEQVEQHMIITTGLDGRAMVWDLRSTQKPMKVLVPDNKGIHTVSVSPIGDCVVLATGQNMYTMNLVDLDAPVLPMLKSPPGEPFSTITWNRQTLEVYATLQDGSISVFRNTI
ncbi:hypothetical protein BSKO_07970 [Bryopsis sp. KO-2023]|nr:hypothetical protein BSKO_07970 [Bryopsis sp. KO-2023]